MTLVSRRYGVLTPLIELNWLSRRLVYGVSGATA